jgi:hypothetical protein
VGSDAEPGIPSQWVSTLLDMPHCGEWRGLGILVGGEWGEGGRGDQPSMVVVVSKVWITGGIAWVCCDGLMWYLPSGLHC